jgi:hypothetical protein
VRWSRGRLHWKVILVSFTHTHTHKKYAFF